MADERIIEKISNLLKRSQEANDAEGEASILLARKLMMKHNISIEKVNSLESENSVNSSKISMKRPLWWHMQLASVVSDNFRCRVLVSGGSESGLEFVGLNDDSIIAKKVFEAAMAHIKYRKSKMKNCDRKTKNSWTQGFIIGLSRKLDAQSNQFLMDDECTALSIQTPTQVNEYVKEIATGATRAKVQSDINYLAYASGMNEGNSASIYSDELLEV